MCAQSQGLFLRALSPRHKRDFFEKEPAASQRIVISTLRHCQKLQLVPNSVYFETHFSAKVRVQIFHLVHNRMLSAGGEQFFWKKFVFSSRQNPHSQQNEKLFSNNHVSPNKNSYLTSTTVMRSSTKVSIGDIPFLADNSSTEFFVSIHSADL